MIRNIASKLWIVFAGFQEVPSPDSFAQGLSDIGPHPRHEIAMADELRADLTFEPAVDIRSKGHIIRYERTFREVSFGPGETTLRRWFFTSRLRLSVEGMNNPESQRVT